jgi:single-stranded-DNA-specific exonuclease
MYLLDSGSDPKTILRLLLKNRGIDASAFHEFLKPSFPQNFLKLAKAVKLIERNLSKNILIYGDYDVDGIVSSTILYQALSPLNPHTFVFLPHREIDGYGFKTTSFLKFQETKKIFVDLLITVDNGIVAGEEFQKIKKKQPKLKILVIDHHLKNDHKLPVDVIIHSTDTSAAALAYFLAKELKADTDLGLAALGVVADCLPLVGINRQIVVHGLSSLRLHPPLPLKLLLDSAVIKSDSLSVYDLSFIIAPRLNAAGRLDDPTLAFSFLNSKTPEETNKYLVLLNRHNQNRQALEKKSLEIADQKTNVKNKFIFISDPSFHPGVIGLIAGRLTEKYHLPSIVISVGEDFARGSCRSVKGFHITNILRQYTNLFIDLGGHSAAAGFSIAPANIPKLKKKLEKYFISSPPITFDPLATVDAQMSPEAVTSKNIKYINLLSPFGIGNPTPTFYFQDIIISSLRQIGTTGDHLKFKFGTLDGVAFRQGKLFNSLKIGQSISFIASLDLNTWNGFTSPQLIIKEILV